MELSNIPAFYHFKIGKVVVTALCDGTAMVNTDTMMLNGIAGEVAGLLQSAYLKNVYEASINAFIFSVDDKLVLVDTGAGDLMGTGAGHLLCSLHAAGYDAEAIDLVLLTHIHGDHSGGLLTNGALAFPNATLIVSQYDIDYWLSEDQMNQVKPERRQSFRNAVNKLSPWLKADRVKTFNEDREILPGLSSLAQHGHTPGHTYYCLESMGQKLLFCADIVHVAEVQLTNPEIAITLDVDPVAAVEMRKQFLNKAANEGFWLAADHINFPGIGHIASFGKGFRWIPVNFSSNLQQPKI